MKERVMLSEYLPVKINQDQVNFMHDHTVKLRKFCEGVEHLFATFKIFTDMNPLLKYSCYNEYTDKFLEQLSVNKQYFAMTEMHLGFVKNNLNMWHSFYIDKNNRKGK